MNQSRCGRLYLAKCQTSVLFISMHTIRNDDSENNIIKMQMIMIYNLYSRQWAQVSIVSHLWFDLVFTKDIHGLVWCRVVRSCGSTGHLRWLAVREITQNQWDYLPTPELLQRRAVCGREKSIHKARNDNSDYTCSRHGARDIPSIAKWSDNGCSKERCTSCLVKKQHCLRFVSDTIYSRYFM